MRISIVKTDPGYRWNARHFTVKVDGAPAQFILTADEEKGEVTRYVLEDGKPKIAGDGEHFVTETVAAHVEIDGKAADGLSARMPKVSVERINGVVHVYVYSRVKPGHIRHTAIDEKTRGVRRSLADEEAAVSITAGAAAEHLIKSLGDVFEPSDVAKLAEEKYRELLRGEQVN